MPFSESEFFEQQQVHDFAGDIEKGQIEQPHFSLHRVLEFHAQKAMETAQVRNQFPPDAGPTCMDGKFSFHHKEENHR